jgi:molybdate transport system permease protein
MNWQAIILTLKLASLTSVVLLLIGLPLAYWLAMSTRWRKSFVEALVALPLVLPPTVLGFYVLITIGSASAIGRVFQHVIGKQLAFTFEGLLIVSILYSLPFAVQPFAAGFRAIDRRILSSAEVLGASRWRVFSRIALPLALPGLVTGVVLSFAHTVGEFGVALMVGGNIPGETRTVSIDIYDNVQELNYAAANQTALVLLIFSLVVLTLVFALNRRVWQGWFSR